MPLTVAPPRAELLRSALVRLSCGPVAVGSGVVVDRRHVLTCAHVVTAAHGVKERSCPDDPVPLDLPYLQPAWATSGRVVGWSYDDTSDVALLELAEPVPDAVRPPLLVTDRQGEVDPFGHSFWTVGFPKGHDRTGRQAGGTLLRRGAHGWVQMQAAGQTGARVEPGFSGAPVWDEQLRAVLGLVVEADRSPTERVAHLLPVGVAAEALGAAWEAVSLEQAVADVVVVSSAGAGLWTSWLCDGLTRRGIGARPLSWPPDRRDLVEVVRQAAGDAPVVVVVVTAQALDEAPDAAAWEAAARTVREAGGHGLVAAVPFSDRRPPDGVPVPVVALRDGREGAFLAEVLRVASALLDDVPPPLGVEPPIAPPPPQEQHAELLARTAARQEERSATLRRRAAGTRVAGARVTSRPQEFFDRVVPAEELAQRLDGPEPGVVCLVGPRGVGKSALALLVVDRLLARAGQADGCPYDGVALLSSRSGTQELTTERVLVLLAELLGPDGEPLRRVWATSAGATAVERVSGLLDALPGGRYLVLLDNLEDVLEQDGRVPDEELRALLEQVRRRPGAGLTVLTTSRCPVQLTDGRLPELRLEEGLPAQDCVALLTSLDHTVDLRLARAPQQQLLRIAERLGGRPRALQLFSAVLAGDRTLTPAALLARLTDREHAVHELAAANYAGLHADARLVVDALAVLGRPAPPEALEWLIEPTLPGFDLGVLINHLVHISVLARDRETLSVSMHPLDADLARAELQAERPEQLRQLHRLAAGWYARFVPDSAPTDLQDLDPALLRFDHLVRAGEHVAAAELLVGCASFLVHRGAARRVKLMHRRLEGRIDDERLGARLAHGYALACKVAGPVDEAVRLLRRCAALAQRLGDTALEADALFLLGDGLRYEGRPAEALDPLRLAVELHRSRRDHGEQLHAMLGLGLAQLYVGRADEALRLAAEMEELARRVDTPTGWARLLDLRSLAHLVRGEPDEALELAREAALRYPAEDGSTGYVRNVEGLALLALDRVEEALVAFERGRLDGAAFDAPRVEGLCLHNRAWALWRAERPEEAVQAARRARAAFARAGSRDRAASDMLAAGLERAQAEDHRAAADNLLEVLELSRHDVDLHAGKDLRQWVLELAERSGVAELVEQARRVCASAPAEPGGGEQAELVPGPVSRDAAS